MEYVDSDYDKIPCEVCGERATSCGYLKLCQKHDKLYRLITSGAYLLRRVDA